MSETAAATAAGTDGAATTAATGEAAGTEAAAATGTQATGEAAADTPAAPAANEAQAVDMTGWPQTAIDAYNRRDGDAKRYQAEAGDNRIAAKNGARAEGKTEATNDIAKALLGVLGVELPGEEPATPEQLAAQVGNVTTERDAARTDAALARVALDLNLDPAKLDYIAFKLGKDGALDPSADDFAGKLKASVTALVAADATLKRSGTVQASGVENLAGSGGADTITPEKFAQMSMIERSKLRQTDQAAYDRLVAN